jgi:kanamycin kinase
METDMKRTLINPDINSYPDDIRSFLQGADIYDSSCSPEARVIFIDKDGGYFLKSSPKGTLKKEADMTSFFHSKGLSTEVVLYRSDESDWLLTKKLIGEDCTHSAYLDDPHRLCDTLAELLRKLHEINTQNCPVADRMSDYFALAEKNYAKGQIDLSYYEQDYGSITADGAWNIVNEGKDLLCGKALLHGDYCLPNVILDNWRFSGFIDLGNGGVGDRHVDIYWGAWTLRFNLGTDKYRERFFDAYGKDKIDFDLLRVVAAAETFG